MSRRVKGHFQCRQQHLNLLCFLLVGMLLQGCAGSPKRPEQLSPPITANERLMMAAENYSGLIDLYKQQLSMSTSQQESDAIQQKLGHAYLLMGDPESALFYIEPVITGGRGNGPLLLMKSRALLAMDKPPEALKSAITALGFNDSDPEVFNQLGLVSARMEEYEEARRYFDKARATGIEDVTSKNNLAMIDILEKHYDAAIKRLMPLYKSGQADNQVRANLLVALAKEGKYKTFIVVYGQTVNEEDRWLLYQALSGTEVRGGYGS